MKLIIDITEHAYNNIMTVDSISLGRMPYKGIIMSAINAIKCGEVQEPKTDKYEYHTDHTDCIWYGNDSGCPTTCSQYRDGWNDAMEYIYKNGKGYQPFRMSEVEE